MKKTAKTDNKILAFAALAMLSACGKIGELQPESGSTGVAAAYGQEKPNTPSELLEPSAQARPGRSVELLRRSQRREDDEFDLPPGTQPILDDSESKAPADPLSNDSEKPKE